MIAKVVLRALAAATPQDHCLDAAGHTPMQKTGGSHDAHDRRLLACAAEVIKAGRGLLDGAGGSQHQI